MSKATSIASELMSALNGFRRANSRGGDRVVLRGPAVFKEAPRDDDLAGVFRLLGAAAGFAVGTGAVFEAGYDKQLTRNQRALAATCGAMYMAAGVVSFARPSLMPTVVRRHPRRTLAASALPLTLVPFTGARTSPLHTLAAAAGGVCGAVYGRQRGRQASHVMGTVWSALARGAGPQPQSPGHPHGVMPMTYTANAALAAMLVSMAYTARTLGVMLARLQDDHQGYDQTAQDLVAALDDARRATLAVLEDPLVHSQASADHLRKTAVRALARVNEDIAALSGVYRYPALKPCRIDAAISRYNSTPPTIPVPHVLAQTVARNVLEGYGALVGGGRDCLFEISHDGRDLYVEGPARIALLGMVISAAAGNALQHNPRLERLNVELRSRPDGHLDVVIRHDLDPGSIVPHGFVDPGEGLKSLMHTAEALGGILHCPRRHDEEMYVHLQMRGRSSGFSDTESLVDWPAIWDKRIRAFDQHALAHALMTIVNLTRRPHPSPVPSVLTAGASLAVIGQHLRLAAKAQRPAQNEHEAEQDEALEDFETQTNADSHNAVKLVGAAALISAFSPDAFRGHLAAWHGAAIARLALQQEAPATLGLTTLGLAGIGVSYLRGTDRSQMLGQMATLAVLPIGLRVTVMPFGSVLEDRDRQAAAALETVELVVSETRRMMGIGHSPTVALGILGTDLVRADARLEVHADRLDAAASRVSELIGSDTELFSRSVNTLIDDMAIVLSARVFPGEAHVVQRDITALGSTPKDAPALLGVKARRTAIAAADLVAREAFSHQPISWNVTRPLDTLKLDISSIRRGQSPFLEVRITPVQWPRNATSRQHPAIRALEARLEKIGAKHAEWQPGEVMFRLRGSR